MTGTDVPEEDRLAEAVVWGLREGAGASDGAAAIVEPITRDVPAGNLGHDALSPIDSQLWTLLGKAQKSRSCHKQTYAGGATAPRFVRQPPGPSFMM